MRIKTFVKEGGILKINDYKFGHIKESGEYVIYCTKWSKYYDNYRQALKAFKALMFVEVI